MDPVLLPQLSDLDLQAEDATNDLGVGLTLVKGIVELYAATFPASSEVLVKGSWTEVRLARL